MNRLFECTLLTFVNRLSRFIYRLKIVSGQHFLYAKNFPCQLFPPSQFCPMPAFDINQTLQNLEVFFLHLPSRIQIIWRQSMTRKLNHSFCVFELLPSIREYLIIPILPSSFVHKLQRVAYLIIIFYDRIMVTTKSKPHGMEPIHQTTSFSRFIDPGKE